MIPSMSAATSWMSRFGFQSFPSNIADMRFRSASSAVSRGAPSEGALGCAHACAGATRRSGRWLRAVSASCTSSSKTAPSKEWCCERRRRRRKFRWRGGEEARGQVRDRVCGGVRGWMRRPRVGYRGCEECGWPVAADIPSTRLRKKEGHAMGVGEGGGGQASLPDVQVQWAPAGCQVKSPAPEASQLLAPFSGAGFGPSRPSTTGPAARRLHGAHP